MPPCNQCVNPTLCTDRCQVYAEELKQCAASGQMTEQQVAAHVEAGEIGEPAESRYKTIVADPPWDYKTPGQFGKTLEHRPNRDIGLSKHGAGSVARYGAMTTDELMALPVAQIADANAHLYLWTTNGFMETAYRVCRAWGFEPKTIITWTKTRQSDGAPSMKMGYYFRGATEHCLFAVRGSLRLQGPASPTAILSPRTPHSVKPEEFYRMVDQQSPSPRLELFARRPRAGWHVWGDEVESDVDFGKGEAGEMEAGKEDRQ